MHGSSYPNLHECSSLIEDIHLSTNHNDVRTKICLETTHRVHNNALSGVDVMPTMEPP